MLSRDNEQNFMLASWDESTIYMVRTHQAYQILEKIEELSEKVAILAIVCAEEKTPNWTTFKAML